MAKLKKGIDTSKIEGSNVAPEGDYVLVATKTEIKKSANNPNNEYIAVSFKIAKGPYKGMMIFNNFNFWNDNESAQNIGRMQWKNLVLAIFGQDLKMSDTDEILNKPFAAELSIKEDDYGKKNIIKKYLVNDDEPDENGKDKKKKKEKMSKESAWAEDEQKKEKKKDKVKTKDKEKTKDKKKKK